MNALISTQSLWQQRDQVQILEVGAKTADGKESENAYSAYLLGHIPTAQYVDLSLQFCNLRTELKYQYPNMNEMRASVAKFGLSKDQKIVIYDRANHIWATRLWWVLHTYGFQHIYILEGGWQAWQSAHFSIEQGAVSSFSALASKFQTIDLQLNRKLFAELKDVEQVVAGQHDAQLVNVLRPEVFRGDELRYTRRGHIPHSINIPFAQFLQANGRFYSDYSFLQTEFGLQFHREIILYCGSGITASGAAFVLQQQQAKHVRIYDGSMSEWSARTDLPLHSMTA